MVPSSPAAQRYLDFLDSVARPGLREPELIPREHEPDELEWQSRWFSGDFGRDLLRAHYENAKGSGHKH